MKKKNYTIFLLLVVIFFISGISSERNKELKEQMTDLWKKFSSPSANGAKN